MADPAGRRRGPREPRAGGEAPRLRPGEGARDRRRGPSPRARDSPLHGARVDGGVLAPGPPLRPLVPGGDPLFPHHAKAASRDGGLGALAEEAAAPHREEPSLSGGPLGGRPAAPRASAPPAVRFGPRALGATAGGPGRR